MMIFEWLPVIGLVRDIVAMASEAADPPAMRVAVNVFTSVGAAQMVLRALKPLARLTPTQTDDRWIDKAAHFLKKTGEILLAIAAADPELAQRLATIKRRQKELNVG